MKKLIWAFAATAVLALILMVFIANDSSSVRIGAWAQFAATLGTILAAFLAFRTADENRAQAKEASQAIAEATRPLLSLTITPNSYGPVQPDPVTPVRLTISNQSKFNVNSCRVDWEMPGGGLSRKDLGPIFANADPSTGMFGAGVSYASGLRSFERFTLGLHEMHKESTIRVIFYYSSTFSNGEWMEVHYWETRDKNENPDSQYWELRHTYDPPKWMPTSP